MREIKFRAWDDINDRMIYDFYGFSEDNKLKTKDGCYKCSISVDENTIKASLSLNKHNDFSFRHVKHIKLMQYTGIKDKDGIEIFEGDIIKTHFYSNPYVDEYGGFHEPIDSVVTAVVKNEGVCIPVLLADYQSVEIIGNIYQNNDLI